MHWVKQPPFEVSQTYGAHEFAAPPLCGIDCVPSALHVAVIAEQEPAAQKNPDAHSAFDAQVVLQAAAPSHA